MNCSIHFSLKDRNLRKRSFENSGQSVEGQEPPKQPRTEGVAPAGFASGPAGKHHTRIFGVPIYQDSQQQQEVGSSSHAELNLDLQLAPSSRQEVLIRINEDINNWLAREEKDKRIPVNQSILNALGNNKLTTEEIEAIASNFKGMKQKSYHRIYSYNSRIERKNT
jgi:hypothetical protein